jgi:hypothetical protein
MTMEIRGGGGLFAIRESVGVQIEPEWHGVYVWIVAVDLTPRYMTTEASGVASVSS